MSNNVSTMTVVLNAGDIYTFTIPCTPENSLGVWPKQTNGFQNGFKVANEEIGKIKKQYKTKIAIDYQHILPLNNIIYFESVTGGRVHILIGNIFVHDHASIKTGGPAYGTYYSEVPSKEEV